MSTHLTEADKNAAFNALTYLCLVRTVMFEKPEGFSENPAVGDVVLADRHLHAWMGDFWVQVGAAPDLSPEDLNAEIARLKDISY